MRLRWLYYANFLNETVTHKPNYQRTERTTKSFTEKYLIFFINKKGR